MLLPTIYVMNIDKTPEKQRNKNDTITNYNVLNIEVY